MMEGMNQMGQEEYIWAMRTSAYREIDDSELWKDRRSYSHSHSMAIKKSKSLVESSAIGDHHTKLMASLVPDEVIYNVNDYSHRQYDACFLFGDVSGFTELCEKYTKTGISGPSRMTQVLNKYLGSMVQEVLGHNGDVLKFSGDAFLAMFKSTEGGTMRDAVHEALDSALVIQKSYGSYLTDVGVVIRVKLAISAGLVTFSLIGNEACSHYVVVGKPIWDVKAAESISSAGDIIVAPAAWHYVNTNEYTFKDMPDNIHVKLLGVGPNWRSVQKNVRQQKTQEMLDDSSLYDDSSESDISELTIEGIDEFSLRPAVNLAARLRIKEAMRKFIITPVMRGIDMDEPIQYLTEMRQAVIVFINVVSHKLQTEETVVLADQTYKIVCSIVDKMNGCVNKVSLFDKDLMFVVIFGLRGLKHELECQVALKCARECHEEISRLTGVLSTSIGVTTGKTYCGVFGHTLRREYTVIGLIVNKAARLMVAYKGKVTCDRETFLHSKLEARHFILQEHRPLKGISQPGPIYEFREEEIDQDEILRINACPILGRTEKLNAYELALKQFLNASNVNEQQYRMLLIKGEARQGKTRLLDECCYITPPDVAINKVTLTARDQKIPYQAFRLMMNLPMGLKTDSSVKEKEQKILQLMRKIQVPDLLFTYNNLLGVHFQGSTTFVTMKTQERKITVKKMVKQLCYAVFVTNWVLAIDDVEFIDVESLELLECFFSINTVFILATMGRDKLGRTNHTNKLVEDARIKVIELKSVEIGYLGALACQLLDVYGISPELENAVQTRSNGNPGWIESFLISLLQDKAIYIIKASLKQINDLGLVCPPIYLMTRMTRDDTIKWQHIMEERKKSLDSMKDDYWKKYIDSCRDSYLNVTIREQMEDIPKDGRVAVCVISHNFRVGDEEAETSMDAMILKTFDSLNFFEQLLVKCSAILGNQFVRDMLLYVMSATSPREPALAVQKLFEIRVLSCAKGDFSDGAIKVSKEKLFDHSDEGGGLKCECKGVKIDESCMDLPKYASCGYMQFRSSLFREITYNLLTDNQKKEFHLRAIRYLEKETRKCKSCGQGYFDTIFGESYDKDFSRTRDKKKVATDSMSQSYDSVSITQSSAHSMSAHSTGSQKTIAKQKFDEKSIASYPSQIYGENKGEKAYSAWFGITIINRLKKSFSLTRGFSTEDFTDCRCMLILSTTYAQLIEHCMGAADTTKVVEAMLEYSYVCITLCNIPLAVRVLDEALAVLRRKVKQKTELNWRLSLIRGKVYTLKGFADLELGHYDEAQKNLHLSLREYNLVFPTGLSKKMKICSQEFKQQFGLYVFPRTLMKRVDYWEAVYSNNLAECLSNLCTLYMLTDQWKDAELAAVWSWTKAMEAFSDFKIICTACANMMQIAQHFERWNLCVALEVHSLRLCHLKKNGIVADDLKCVAALYGNIFYSRLYRSDMDKAIHIGYIVLRLCTSIRAVKIVLPMLPLLVHSLLIGKHFSNTFSVLQELEFFSDEDSDNSGKVWYFAICIGLQLETGYAVVSYHTCENFYQIEGENWITIRDPDARKRFFTVMWLWCIRNEKWEAASIWCLKTNDFMVLSEKDSINNKITALYLLEGMILFLVCKLDKRNVKAVIRAENEIKHLIKAIERAAKTTKMILPRLLHLKAYFQYVKGHDSKVKDMLKKARKCSLKYKNELEIAWIDHSLKAWTRTLPAIAIDFWREHSEPDGLLEFQDIEVVEGRLGFFTLPVPIYVQ